MDTENIESQAPTETAPVAPSDAPPVPAEPTPTFTSDRIRALLRTVVAKAQPGDPHGWYAVGQEAADILTEMGE